MHCDIPSDMHNQIRAQALMLSLAKINRRNFACAYNSMVISEFIGSALLVRFFDDVV